MALIGLCLVLLGAAGAASGEPVFVPAEHFTLAWTHSIEKVRWEEDYAVVPGPNPRAPPVLLALASRIRGSGAGMEPPPDARLVNGWYEYTPTLRHPGELRLTRSGFTADYDLCMHGQCQVMSALLPSDGGVTLLTACRSPRT